MSSRLAMRLSSLPASELAELLATALDDSPEARRSAKSRVEDLLARRNPVPQWAVTNILLSEDLAPSIIIHLRLVDVAAAVVCTAWNGWWRDSREARRELHFAPSWVPLNLGQSMPEGVVCTRQGDGGPQSRRLHFVTGSGHLPLHDVRPPLPTHFRDSSRPAIVAGEHGLYIFDDAPRGSFRYELGDDGHFEMRTSVVIGAFWYGSAGFTIVPGGSIFAAVMEMDDHDECVCALDPLTLEMQQLFGEDRLQVRGLAASANEVFICDGGGDRSGDDRYTIQVYDTAGVYRRDIRLHQQQGTPPRCVAFHRDRLYLSYLDADSQAEVFSLTTAGVVLQCFCCGVGGLVCQLCPSGDELLVLLEGTSRSTPQSQGALLKLRGV